MSENHLVAVHRTLHLFERMAESSGGLPFGQIERDLSVSAASLTRLLKTLLAEGWIELSTERHYLPGQRLQNVMRGMSGRWTVGEMVSPAIRELAIATGQSACFATYANYGFSLLAKYEMAESYHFIARNVVNEDIITNGIGQTILSHLDEQKRTEIIRRKVSEFERSKFEKMMDDISQKSIHVSKENSVTRIVAPVISDASGELHGVVSLALLGRHPMKSTKQFIDEILSTVTNVKARLHEVRADASHEIKELKAG